MKAICGLDCETCWMRKNCKGCAETNGRPFGGTCMLSACCHEKGHEACEHCASKPCELQGRLIAAFNALNIPDMDEVKHLNALHGAYINLEYTLPSGQTIKIWDDDRVLLGNQLEKHGSSRCYGIAGDEHYLTVSEYGENGANAELIIFKKWN